MNEAGEAWFDVGVRALRYPVRAVAAVACALAVAGSFADAVGIAGAILGAIVGTVAGELLGRSRVRSAVIVGAAAVAWPATALVATACVELQVIPFIVGPAWALRLASLVGFGGGMLVATALLRSLSTRYTAALYAELAAMIGGIAALVAAHRNGAIARPLWLSDAAWRHGIDPSVPLALLGVTLALLCAAYALLETKNRLPRAAWLLLPVFVVFAALVTHHEATQPPAMPHSVGDAQHLPTATGAGSAGASGTDGIADAGDPTDKTDGNGGQPKDPGDQTDGSGGTPKDPGDKTDGTPGTPKDPGDKTDGSKPPNDPKSPDKPQDPDPLRPDGTPKGQDTDAPPSSGRGGGSSGDTDVDTDAPQAPFDPDPNHDAKTGGGNPPVAVVILDDDDTPPSGYFYLREEALSYYDGHRLVVASEATADRDLISAFPTRVTPVIPPASTFPRTTVHQRVSLIAEHPRPFALDTPVQFGPMINPAPTRFQRAYTADSLAPTWTLDKLLGHTAGDPAWSPELQALYTAAPTDPRYAALAHKLVSGLPAPLQSDPFGEALAIKQYLDKNMKYTKRERHAKAADPVADFLFGNLTGYCVHSAHASVYLWRSLGLPARVSTGYAVDVADQRGSTLIVRAGDAHAWPELYLDGVGWVILDISPAKDLDPPGQPLDEDLANLLGEMARQTPTEKPAINWAPIVDVLVFAAKIAALALFVAALSGHYIYKAWRRARPFLAADAAMPRVGYRAALDRLAEAGFSRANGESREAFARRVLDRAPSFAVITDLHLAGALGNHDRSRPEYRRELWLAVLRDLRRETPNIAPWWRRWLGLVDPTSFYRAR